MDALSWMRAREDRLGGLRLLGGRALQSFAWPFHMPYAIARLGDKYLVMALALRCGLPFKKPALIALISNDMGGLHRLWCMNFTALVLVVR
jgi:hypothetical protein